MKKIIIFLAISLISTLVFANWDIREIPFDDQSDTRLSERFDAFGWNLREDTKFVEGGILAIVDLMRKLMWTTAVIWAFYAGFQLVVSQWDEDTVNKSKRQLRWSIIALLLILLADPLLRTVFYWWGWGVRPWDAIMSAEAAKTWVLEMEWLISYLQTFVALIALFMIVTVWIKTIFSLDKEEAIENQTKTITWIWIWMILIFLNKVFIYAGVLWNPVTWEERNVAKLIWELSWVLWYFLWFVWALAVWFLIYWWFLMITSSWEDDQNTKWKNIVINLIIGIVIIVLSYALVSDLILSWRGGGG